MISLNVFLMIHRSPVSIFLLCLSPTEKFSTSSGLCDISGYKARPIQFNFEVNRSVRMHFFKKYNYNITTRKTSIIRF